MNTITIIILTIIAWQLIYVIAVNLTDNDDTVASIIGGGVWLIPIVIINKIYQKWVDKTPTPCYNKDR